MKNKYLTLALILTASAFGMFGAWVAGCDFQRGYEGVMLIVMAVAGGALGAVGSQILRIAGE